MTDKMRSADVHAEIFVTPATNGSFAKEQTLAKIGATTEMRTYLPDADATKLTLVWRSNPEVFRNGAADFPEREPSIPDSPFHRDDFCHLLAAYLNNLCDFSYRRSC